ncbi:hypothetical protein RIF29_12825 [Crotalaria pallida]|uniref:CN hydrolase domain-containing protein n=1 Tax=Crotalaria pallida TaxID=3830 RepID=A0AAN9INV1_CROPI
MEVGRIGIGICYDIRFPELAMIYAARGAHLLCYPGAFNMTTGPLHWELLQRARATDNQLFVATCSPARDTGPGYVAWGHSTLVGSDESPFYQATKRRYLPIGGFSKAEFQLMGARHLHLRHALYFSCGMSTLYV